MRKILYTGAFRFPAGDAAAARVFAVGKLLETIGGRVDFAGWEKSASKHGRYQYRGQDCFAQAEFRDRERWFVARFFGFIFRGKRTLKWILKNNNYDIIVAYNPPVFFSLGLLLLARLYRFHLVLDNTEWYESSHLPGGRFGPAAFENWLRMVLIYPLFNNIICISKFLERHFTGRNVIRIPPLTVDLACPTVKPDLSKCVNFIYAGEMGRKDKLFAFIRVLPELQNVLQRRILLRIVGVTWAEYANKLEGEGINLGVYQSLVECYGRVSRECVGQLYENSHFSVFMREDRRYALAGFPTKAVESWSNGCPIITNRVGDVGVVAKDMVDSIIVEDGDMVGKLSSSLVEIIANGKYLQMSNECVLKSNRLFHINSYRLRFSKFFARFCPI